MQNLDQAYQFVYFAYFIIELLYTIFQDNCGLYNLKQGRKEI